MDGGLYHLCFVITGDDNGGGGAISATDVICTPHWGQQPGILNMNGEGGDKSKGDRDTIDIGVEEGGILCAGAKHELFHGVSPSPGENLLLLFK